jgi:hypothetical protein
MENEVALETNEQQPREVYQRPQLVRHEPLLRVTGTVGSPLPA